MKTFAEVTWLIIYLTAIISGSLYVALLPLIYVLGGVTTADQWLAYPIILTLLLALLMQAKNEDGSPYLFKGNRLLVMIGVLMCMCSCQEHPDTVVISGTPDKQQMQELITAHQDYYFAVETLLDRIQDDVDLETEYLETTEEGKQYLEFKAVLDSLCYEAYH